MYNQNQTVQCRVFYEDYKRSLVAEKGVIKYEPKQEFTKI